MINRECDYRLRYNKNKPPPNRLIVWDVKNNKEYATDRFTLDNCTINMFYGNSKAQEKACGAKLILEVYKNEEVVHQ